MDRGLKDSEINSLFAQAQEEIDREQQQEKFIAEKKLQAKLETKSKELGVRLLLPNQELPDLDVRSLFCQNREFLIAPEAWGEPGSEALRNKGKTRPFVGWESHGPQWHSDEEAVRAEMAAKFPQDPLFAAKIDKETFSECQHRKVKIIEAWEKMKDQEAKK